MPRPLALVLTCAFVFYLFRRDMRENRDASPALWLPLIWILIYGSRPISAWLYIWFGISTAGSLEEGSPVDRSVTLGLFLAGAYVLKRRQFSPGTFLRQNPWVVVFLLYGFIAISWSDYPFVSFKRWFRALAEPTLVLVVLTDSKPMYALMLLVKRATYVLAPFSIMLIKWFPEIGRRFSVWGGGESGGVTGGKNALGHVCLILGFFLFCHLLNTIKQPKGVERRRELWLVVVLGWMIWWNLIEANSSTSLTALVLGMVVAILLGRSFVNRRLVGAYAVAAIAVIWTADSVFGLYEYMLQVLGRDESLTGRADLWTDLLSMPINPVLGVGFEAFWLGDRLDYLWRRHWWKPNEAHNGYLETYLNLGIVGLTILIALMLSSYRHGRQSLIEQLEWGRIRLGFLAAVIVYNWTESGFRPMHLMLFMFYMVTLRSGTRAVQARRPGVDKPGSTQVTPAPTRRASREWRLPTRVALHEAVRTRS